MAVVDETMEEAQTKLATIGVKASMKCDWDSYDKISWLDSSPDEVRWINRFGS